MAKRFSSGLQAMKFMQRGRDAAKKGEEDKGDDDHWVSSTAPSSRRCVVIMEGDPKPAASLGRMSFQNYNPSIDKIHEDIQARRFPKAASSSDEQQADNETKDSDERTKAESSTSAGNTKEENQQQPASKKRKAENHHKPPEKPTPKNPINRQTPASQNRFDAIRAQGFRKPPKF
ncbi:M-phase phosphoprotein 6-like [Selaginella moellendorffii]|uniref:M-phase phosphoprotein 6-like n=1 Tax=Selaginella moellendorffii TaxID=88036 RepID=UPI000D1C7502|nr:M-phase phosphoprotein 6-like [Selaginella moellendorffii]|eukprot:XP_024524963.1 M-phase phosphoprotein 6-like [Selaginella moellendorffii]